MNRRILCVDDEVNVLEALERNLFDQFEISTAIGGEAALATITASDAFAVVVSDMRMPGLSGAELLAEVRQRSPDTARILLTGHSEMNDAIAAVNRGGIFRFLCKPCPTEDLINSIEEGVEQFRLIRAEKQLLEETLSGAVKTLTDVLAVASPGVFHRATRLRSYVEHMMAASDKQSDWRIDLAAQLALIGCIALPSELVEKVLSGATVTPQDRQLFDKHPETGRRLIGALPRLEPVAEMIGHQMTRDLNVIDDDDLRFGVELLQVALAVDERTAKGEPIRQAIRHLCKTIRPDGRALLDTMASFEDIGTQATLSLPLAQLRIGMILEADVVTPTGAVVLPLGRQLTLLHLDRLKHFAEGVGIVEPIRIRPPKANGAPGNGSRGTAVR